MSLKSVSVKPSLTGSVQSLEIVEPNGEKTELVVVPAGDQHRSFILSTWIRSWLASGRLIGTWVSEHLDDERRVAEANWSGAMVLTDSDGYVVYAWVLPKDGHLDYVYVAPEVRKIGIAKAMASLVCDMKSRSRSVSPTAPAWIRDLKFNPYIFGR